jgi:hypothetical protein
MAGRKNIALIGTNGLYLNQYWRYKKVRTAVRRAIEVSLESGKTVQIWHLDRGLDIAQVRSGKWGIGVDTSRPTVFRQLWEAE